VASEGRQVLLHLYTDFGINCMLNISPSIQGSIFEFDNQGRSFSLSVDRGYVEQGEVVKMIFLAEG